MKIIIKQIYFVSIICISLFVLQSCGSSKKATTTKKAKGKSAKYLQKKLEKTTLEFEWFSSKAKVTYKAKEIEQSFTSFVRMKKDSTIWVSIYAVGLIEIGRVLITRDQVQILDKVNKKYYLRDNSIIKDYIDYPIDFELLQNALLGLPLYDINKKSPKAAVSGNNYFLENLIEKVNNRLWISPDDFTIRKMQLYDDENQRRLDVLLDDFMDIGKAKFSKGREIKVLNKEAYNIKIQYSRADFEKELKFPFTVPPKYERDES